MINCTEKPGLHSARILDLRIEHCRSCPEKGLIIESEWFRGLRKTSRTTCSKCDVNERIKKHRKCIDRWRDAGYKH